MLPSLLAVIFIQSIPIVQPLTQAQIPGSRPVRPVLEDKPVYTDNYIPAAMQVMFHLSDLMKYDISAINKPQKPQKVTTTTTVQPTSSHKPGVFAPSTPPTTIRTSLDENHKDTLESNEPLKVSNLDDNQLIKDILYLAEGPKKILNQISRVDDEDSDFIDDDDENDFNVEKFFKDYDDKSNAYLKLPRVPPTSAYVSILSLYDALNKEAKRQGLNRFNGYTAQVLESLVDTSSGTAIDQLKFVLNKVIENSNTKTPEVVNKIKRLLSELDRSDGLIAKAIRYYPAMKFSS